jgi:RNA polymerase sigma factor (sigma-70 family)
MATIRTDSARNVTHGVDLTPEVHAALLSQVVAGRAADALPYIEVVAGHAADALIAAYRPWIIAMSTRQTWDRQVADSRAAEALFRFSEALKTYDPSRGAPLGAYALPHITNSRINRAGALAAPDVRTTSLDDARSFGVEQVDAAPMPDEAVEAAALAEAIAAALGRLSAEDRLLFIQAEGYGTDQLSQGDLGEPLGVNRFVIMRRLQKIRETLAADLAAWRAA